ncbi:glyoxalase [Roseivirga sp. 4D4]|uniref:VOC family protein n=1 Tax=Roseivirga sp. 4D4 TaxID=1889784 RepID=UPI000852A638|nr:VOC family protein [Roseivirga sp. 4D4]OEK02894.1 glyoxalase [Roseivirga sp. 4D4]
MRRLSVIILFATGIVAGCYAQNNVESKKQFAMKMNAGIITEKIQETKAFYQEKLGFGVTFENEFYLLMHTPGHEAQLSFLLPEHPTQQPLFQPKFMGEGMYLTIEVDDVDELYNKLKSEGVKIEIDIRDEPWGDRHFAIKDPNGIGIDLVKYTAQN